MKKTIKTELERAYEASKSHNFNIEEWKNEEWESIKETSKYGKMKDTGVAVNALKDLGEKITTLPDD